MTSQKNDSYIPWPALPYPDFSPTAYLLHRAVQMLGKLKLETPFEPQWANVALWLTSRGLTTGPIPYKSITFSVDIDLIAHTINCSTSSGKLSEFKLGPSSVKQFYDTLFNTLRKIGINITVNPKPQEVPDPILFDQDTELRPYEAQLANAWWRILVSSHQVMQRYHGQFTGRTPPIGLMWGTLDLRDVRSVNTPVPIQNAGYILRNAMEVHQIEVGWWHGNPQYQQPAYFAFTYPQPPRIEQEKIQPQNASWNNTLKEFLLDYEKIRTSQSPEKDLLAFFQSTYQAGAERDGWDPKLIGPGKPI